MELFTTFTWLALQGFGGVLAIAQRVLCTQKRWLSDAEFVELLALAQVLPGPNVCNLAVMIGDRHFGFRGACAALAGMMAAPLLLVLTLAALYARLELDPMVAGALKGMGAVAAGMIAGTGLRLAGAMRTNPIGLPACGALGASAFVMIAWLRWPLVWVLLGLGTLGCGLAWRSLRPTISAG